MPAAPTSDWLAAGTVTGATSTMQASRATTVSRTYVGKCTARPTPPTRANTLPVPEIAPTVNVEPVAVIVARTTGESDMAAPAPPTMAWRVGLDSGRVTTVDVATDTATVAACGALSVAKPTPATAVKESRLDTAAAVTLLSETDTTAIVVVLEVAAAMPMPPTATVTTPPYVAPISDAAAQAEWATVTVALPSGHVECAAMPAAPTTA
jgi:hypothetical protein